MRLSHLPLAVSLSLGVFLMNGCGGGSNGSGSTPAPTPTPVQPASNPTPSVSAIAPASVLAGSAAQTLTLTGAGFLSSSTASFDGVTVPATYVSATSLQVAVPASSLAAGETAVVVVSNPSPGGGPSSAANFSVMSPTPVIASVTPAQVPQGAAITLTIDGSGFEANSAVLWNGSIRPTTFVNGSSLHVTLTAADLQTAGTGQITVNNPGPAGTVTAPSPLLVVAPPVVAGIRPADVQQSVAAGLTITGTGFQPNSTVLWNGSARPTNYVNSTTLRTLLPVADTASAGTGKISVSNLLGTGPATVASGTATLNIVAPPSIATLNPSTIPLPSNGSGPVTVTVTGTNFAAKATASISGNALSITSQSATQIVASVPVNVLYSTGLLSVVVANPPLQTGDDSFTSAPANLTVISPTASFSVSPNNLPSGSPATQVNIYGSGFFADTVVTWNGLALATTYGSTNSLTATVPASLLSTLGVANIGILTPENQGQEPPTQPFSTYLPLPVNDLAWNATDGLIYATLAGSGGPGLGNSLVAIDPNTGVIQKTIPVGSEPNRLALSSDGTQAYVGLDGAGAVRQVNLQTATAGTQFSLGGGNGIYNPPYTAESLAVPPGQPNSVAVYSNGGVLTIYDSGVARAHTSSGLQTYFSSNYGGLAFGSSASTLYVSSEAIGSYVYALTVDSTGVTGSQQLNTSGSGRTLQYDNGALYFPVGIAANATTGATLGQFSTTATYSPGSTVAAVGPIVSDSALNRAWIVLNNFNNPGQVLAYDETTFNQVAALPVTGGGSPADLIRWGQTGLAFHSGSQLYILHGSIVKDNSTSPADLSVTAQVAAKATTGTSLSYQFQVSNLGPNSALGTTLIATMPASLSAISVSATQGSCTGAGVVYCDLGAVANGATATITVTGTPTVSGNMIATANVSAQSYDPASGNNQVNAATAVSGGLFSAQPVVTGLSPNFVSAGGGTFTLTVNGSGYSTASTVLWNGTALPSTLVNSSQLTATVDASLIKGLGWAEVSVNSAAPGGGQSRAQTLSIYSLLNVAANAMVYEPYTRKLYAALPSTSTAVTGNSLVTIDPATGTLGQPVSVGSEPNLLAETTSGNYMYVGLSGAQSLGRFNLLTQTLDLTAPLSATSYFGTSRVAATGLATLPGVDNSIFAAGVGILDIAGSTVTARANTNVGYNDVVFTDPTHLYAYDNQSTGAQFYRYAVNASGVQLTDGTTLFGFGGFSGTFALDGGLVYASGGGIVNPSTTPPSQVGLLPLGNGPYGTGLLGAGVVPYAAEQKAFNIGVNAAGTALTFLARYDTQHFVQEDQVQFPSSSIGPAVMGTRWGQDGLAYILPAPYGSSTTNQILILRGPFVLPAEATVQTAPSLSSVGSGSIAAGSGNQQLTIVGAGFLPGASVFWNGTALTTTFLDAQHLTAAVGASNVQGAGTVSVNVQNPGSGSSSTVTVTVQ